MSLTRTLFAPDRGFTPLFRLLEDFDNYSQQTTVNNDHRHRTRLPTFQPNFDVREIEDAYELHGELPGMNKKDVHMEFTDPQTLLIRGRVERSYTAGTPPAGLIEGTKTKGAITESGEQTGGDKSTTPDTSAEKERESDKAKYWVAERSIGEFSRSFSFAHAVQQDAVSATLRDGILTVRVPKAKKSETRRTININ